MRQNISIRGAGGQGIITAGMLLAGAAVEDGKCAAMNPRYTPEVRGGVTSADVVTDDNDIQCPYIMKADYVVCLSVDALHLGMEYLDRHTIMFLDEGIECGTILAKYKVIRVPFTITAQQMNHSYINIIAAAFIAEYASVASRSAFEKALVRYCPGTVSDGRECMRAGWKLADRWRDIDQRMQQSRQAL